MLSQPTTAALSIIGSPPAPYLTDGSTLYRYVGGVPGGTGELVVLEDCHSAKLVLFSLDELRALKLRDVDPVASEVGPGASE